MAPPSRIQLFSERHFGGNGQSFTDNFAALGYRRVCPKSAIVENGAWTLYSNLGFQGRYLTLPAGRYDDLTMILNGIGFYETQSLRVVENPALAQDGPCAAFASMSINSGEAMET
ncbi:unnamed protein product [Oikopleura dioica]|uniref:Beta/gamma crystallin 'Greek key' domain-containing protein n=1 Tax=Oikopleura dioica TaxID=34765 RepID=E4X106_OIKDI|nr:unnamed protein product [Oikopleura dioica]